MKRLLLFVAGVLFLATSCTPRNHFIIVAPVPAQICHKCPRVHVATKTTIREKDYVRTLPFRAARRTSDAASSK